MCYSIVSFPTGANDESLGGQPRRGTRRSPEMVVEVVVQREVAISRGNDGREGQCVCSPTSHPGSFRCRNHRSDYKWTSHAKSCEAPKPCFT
uniref:Uncharacterized protein n=1 Tax=Chenopodium quinoa TaxID=63459 RepID=A0A803LNB7_CHEQI